MRPDAVALDLVAPSPGPVALNDPSDGVASRGWLLRVDNEQETVYLARARDDLRGFEDEVALFGYGLADPTPSELDVLGQAVSAVLEEESGTIQLTTSGLIYRQQFNAADQPLDGFDSWGESDPGSYNIVSEQVEARWASTEARQAYRDLNSGEQEVIVQVNMVRHGGDVLGLLRMGATSLSPHDTTGSYSILIKAGSGWRIFKGGVGELASGGSAPALDDVVTVRGVVEIDGADHHIRAYSADAANLQDLSLDLSLVVEATDASAPDLADFYGLQAGDGSNSANSDFDEFFACGRKVTITGLPSGWKAQIDSRPAVVETSGAVTFIVDTWGLPATTIRVLDDSDQEIDSLAPDIGIWGGHEFTFS